MNVEFKPDHKSLLGSPLLNISVYRKNAETREFFNVHCYSCNKWLKSYSKEDLKSHDEAHWTNPEELEKLKNKPSNLVLKHIEEKKDEADELTLSKKDFITKYKAIVKKLQSTIAKKELRIKHLENTLKNRVRRGLMKDKKVKDDFYESNQWKMLRFKVLEKYGRICALCRCTTGPMHVDHIKPRYLYPNLELEFNNLQVLCAQCNQGKSIFSEKDFRGEK